MRRCWGRRSAELVEDIGHMLKKETSVSCVILAKSGTMEVEDSPFEHGLACHAA